MKQISIFKLYLEQIYAPIRGLPSVVVTSCVPKEGTTSVAIALAQRSAADNKKTLLIDLNLDFPFIGKYFNKEFVELATAEKSFLENITETSTENLSILPAPTDTQFILDYRDRENLQRYLEMCQQTYEKIIIDASSIIDRPERLIPSENVCACAAGCVLVVLAGKTIEAKVVEVVDKLSKNEVNLVGTVLNDKYNPRLDQELARQTWRFQRFLPKQMEKLRSLIEQSSIINVDT